MPNDRTGHINQAPWQFDFAVSDSEGLSLLNLSFNGVLILAKGSIPVIRVKYVRDWQYWYPFDCGPFADQISWTLRGPISDAWRGPHHLVKIENCGNEWICSHTFTSGGHQWLEMGVYARIGAYHLYQAWFLSESGMILPRLFSKGLACNLDHVHHPYWRLDFDIDEPGFNRVYHRDSGNWFWYPNEVNDVKNPAVNRVWFVRNERTGHGVWVRPGPHDGMPDGFSRIDVGVRRYHDAEDRGWWWGAWGGLQYLDGESVDNTDIVFWYVGHLEHHAGEGGDAWHDCGPNLQVHLA